MTTLRSLLGAVGPGLALATYLLTLRAIEALSLRLELPMTGWLAIGMQVCAYVALAELGLRAMGLAVVRIRWVPRSLPAIIRIALYVMAALEHHFFVQTGTRLEWVVFSYAIQNAAGLTQIANNTVDTRLLFGISSGMLLYAFGARLAKLSRVTAAESWRRNWTPGWTAALVCAVILLAAPTPGFPASHLPSPPLLQLAVGFSSAVTGEAEALGVKIRDLYEPPEITSAPEAPKNIILVILESTRADALGPWARAGAPVDTPSIDRIAARSAVVDRAYTTVSHTSKALVGIICGTYPRLTSRIIETLPGGLPAKCLPSLLREQGYRTAFMQTADGEFENRPDLLRNFGYEHHRVQQDFDKQGFGKTGYLGIDDFAMLDEAVSWADAGDEPFFLTLLTITTHHPYVVPGRPSRGTPRADYDEAITHVDRFVGQLYDRLRLGEREDTILVIVGDHGQAFGEHVAQHHNAVPYEEGTWVPLLVHAPGEVEPGRIKGLRHQVDIVPTLLDLLGLKWRGVLPGRDLLTTAGHATVFTSCWYENVCGAVRDGDLKYIHHFGLRPPEVFDLSVDPLEQHDISGKLPAATLRALRSTFLGFHASVAAEYAYEDVENLELAPAGGAPSPLLQQPFVAPR